ncbi:hypothetical protein [Novosphingobium sp. BW1]|uniref:hypothetical protein n=1 Tax=Novosphingobium sp. BW1 TaxID=2592621 RepID=UPI0011DEBACF|nr:hypothetical protein [Novosphingobium sp. BW1]TYC93998.1 hypothetical protein FMM79_01035 [Novosphingobium sp. BW1]
MDIHEHLKLPSGATLKLAPLADTEEPTTTDANTGARNGRRRDMMTATTTTEPARARAVLSNQDFKLLQDACLFYLKAHEDDPISSKYSALYHRLGSAIRR